MKIAKTISEIRHMVTESKKSGLKSVGFVPTMGCLHRGHMSLVERARKENDIVVVSIFVNPTQFAPTEDFDRYPRKIEDDVEMCKQAGTDILFIPEVEQMYPDKLLTKINVQNLTEVLCGKLRIGHFEGVCTVVAKLFNIVIPDRAYFGEKDFQQLIVIKKMVKDLNFCLEIVGCPIIREEDGIAMSSRNRYLDTSERRAALVLNQSLKMALDIIKGGETNSSKIKEKILDNIGREKLAKVEYVKIVDQTTLEEISEVEDTSLIAMAVFIGKTRLIDNIATNTALNKLS
jgi:pantoate--beta-alanine ligase